MDDRIQKGPTFTSRPFRYHPLKIVSLTLIILCLLSLSLGMLALQRR